MKLKDIVAPLSPRTPQQAASQSNNEILATEELMWSAIEELQLADASGLVASSIYLEEDERELAEIILNQLRDLSYRPSPIIFQAIKAINARVLLALA